jgi:rhamnosyltransferase
MVFSSSSIKPFKSIAAVIPAYQPDPVRLCQALELLAIDCRHLFVVDNGGLARALEGWSKRPAGLEILGNGVNLGVAAAQNLGIRRAVEVGADAVLFLDQDSLPRPEMVRVLVQRCGELLSEGRLVAACGPRYHDPGGNALSGFVRLGGLGLRLVNPPTHDSVVECAFLISSGMLVPLETLKKTGFMEEPLFIDHVDTEWCFRAAAHGFSCFGIAGAVMEHELGRKRKKIWLGRWRQIPDHPPERYFYLVRNTLWLVRRDYIPVSCKLHLLSRLFGLLFVRVLIAQKASSIMTYSFYGLCSGVTKKKRGFYRPMTLKSKNLK